MVSVVRFALGCYCLFWTLRYWYWWRTANLSAKHGGNHNNPLNDPNNFCCIYDAPPCPLGVVCVPANGGGGGAERIVLRVPLRSLLPWLVIALALGLVLEGSGTASLGALILATMVSRGWF